MHNLASARAFKVMLKIALMIAPVLALMSAANSKANEVSPQTAIKANAKVAVGRQVAQGKGTAKKTILGIEPRPKGDEHDPPASDCRFTDKPSNPEEDSVNCHVLWTETAVKAPIKVQINVMQIQAAQRFPPTANSGVVESVTKPARKIAKSKHRNGQGMGSSTAPASKSISHATPHTLAKPSISIISPTKGEILRSNSGILDIAIEVYADLSITEATESLERKIFLDGKLVASGLGTTFRLPNVGRGEHWIKATLHHGEGKKIAQSPQITFTLLRHSIIRR